MRRTPIADDPDSWIIPEDLRRAREERGEIRLAIWDGEKYVYQGSAPDQEKPWHITHYEPPGNDYACG